MSIDSHLSRNVKHLPDCWNKSPCSNNDKLLALNESVVNRLLELFSQLDNSLDIYQATGKTLDDYGAAVGQNRGDLSDDRYRKLILTRIAVNVSGCDFQTVVDNIKQLLKCDYSDFELSEAQEDPENPLPATVSITRMPYTILEKSGFNSEEIFAIIKMLLPVGVGLEFPALDGTFEFCEIEEGEEQDALRGFADIEENTGGTWSMLVGQDTQLPL